MPNFGIDPQNEKVVDARDASENIDYLCTMCLKPMNLVRPSERSCAHFRHKKRNDECQLSIPQPIENVVPIGDTSSHKAPSPSSTDWHIQWQALASESIQREKRGIGHDTNRPRDLADADGNVIVELQHSPMTSTEFKMRNSGVGFVLWIFDATTVPIMKYKYADNVWFCSDHFRNTYKSDDNCRVIFHCSDGHLYKTACDDVVVIDVDDDRKYVRILNKVDADSQRILNEFFDTKWPLKQWTAVHMPTFSDALMIEAPVKVISESGRSEIDRCHRTFMNRFPTQPRTVVVAPPGSGKTTAIINMIREWQKRVLVITYNKATQERMSSEIYQAGLKRMADAATLDSLCNRALPNKDDILTSDRDICNAFWPKSTDQRLKTGLCKGIYKIIEFRFRHPNANCVICSKHAKIDSFRPWKASFESYPMKKIILRENKNQAYTTFGARRYICDTQRLLGSKLDAYDAIIVDEMQDFPTAQEQRLLRQTSKPIVLLGDTMQAIYDFRDDLPCNLCKFDKELQEPLERTLEWYGTWRLDDFTAKFVEERFGVRIFSNRIDEHPVEIYWKDELVYEANTLVMCRCNESVVDLAQRYPSIRVVRGGDLSRRLKQASNDNSMLLPLAQFAQSLRRSGELDEVCEMLCERSVQLASLDGTAAVTTAHQAKGFEYDHCAVHSDLLSPGNELEVKISYVAFTRHKKSLVVMQALDRLD